MKYYSSNSIDPLSNVCWLVLTSFKYFSVSIASNIVTTVKPLWERSNITRSSWGEGGETKQITKDHKCGGGHKKITGDHDHKWGGVCKNLVKLKFSSEFRISYQCVVQEVISS